MLLGSEDEESSHQVRRTLRADSSISQSMLATPASVIELDDDEGYGKQADEIITRVWQMFQDKESWISESKGSSGLDVIVAKTYPKWGKVFRLTVINTKIIRKSIE